MGLRDELEPARASRTCTVKEWVTAQEDPAEWIELMDDASVQGTAIFRLMRKYGYPFGETAVGRHRRGGCMCGRTA